MRYVALFGAVLCIVGSFFGIYNDIKSNHTAYKIGFGLFVSGSVICLASTLIAAIGG